MFTKKKKIITPLALSTGVIGLVAVFAAGIFTPDTQPIGYVGQPVVSKFIVSTGNEKLYAGDYSSSNWSGNLHSYNLSSAGAISATDNWAGGAAAKINAQHFNTGRNIVTFGDSAGVPFKWTSGISTTQRVALDATTASDTTKTTSPILDYIRGDFSQQQNQTPAGTYRTRTSKLGDIIHSTPVHWSDGATTPTKTVFVGANDGMLHAINADDGTERFAYIPSVLIPQLAQLTNPAYTHKYYVDGRLDVSNFNGGTQTILAGALGAGGKGLFALDVTAAAATDETDAASKILWEITNTGIKSKDTSVHNITSTAYENLGYTYGAPTLLTLPDGTKALAVGNGYNNTGNGHASLFLINAATGALIQEFDTGSGSTTSPNGLSTPTFWDTNKDGKRDTAYAGDIDGNLWKFDLSGTYSSTTKRSATLLHTTSPAQAITTAPNVIPHPLGGYMINFVTGRMLTAADKNDTTTHYAYGIWDGAGSNTGMLTQTLTERTYTSGTTTTRVRTASNTAPDWTTQKGWKVALPIGGERLVGDGALIKDSVFVFLSTNPTISPTATPPGDNWWMQLNALTGGSSYTVQFDLNKDGAFSSTDEVTVGTESLKPVGRHFGGGVRSQLIQLSALGNDVFQANYDKNWTAIPATTTTATTTNVVNTPAERGVSGGHFDVDIFCKTNCSTATGATAGKIFRGTDTKGYKYTHVHEYDDIYDVTGVDMLKPSQNLLKLSKVQIGAATFPATTSFKVLVHNQAYSPAVKFSIGGNEYVKIYEHQTQAGLTVASLPSYTLSTVNTLKFNLPLDAFKHRDWGNGVDRAGLHPTKALCVYYDPIPGPLGERRGGALTFQIIKASVAQNDIRLNVANRPDLGYRLKDGKEDNLLIAEYTTFWHHPDNLCMGDPGWKMKPDEDATSDAVAATPAAGSSDPKDGIFSLTPTPVTGTPGTSTNTTTTTTSTNNPNGTTTTVTTTVVTTTVTNTDGSKTTTTDTTTTTSTTGLGDNNGTGVVTGGALGGGVPDPTGETGPTLAIGRINWRELQQ